MKIRKLGPWHKGNELTQREAFTPLWDLHHEIDNVLDSFFKEPFQLLRREPQPFIPNLNVLETEKELQITAELPGLSEADVDLSISNDILTLKGEKKEETKDEKKNFYRYECQYGSFQRQIQLPKTVEADHAEATFKKGVLQIRFPKTKEAQHVKKISIKKEE